MVRARSLIVGGLAAMALAACHPDVGRNTQSKQSSRESAAKGETSMTRQEKATVERMFEAYPDSFAEVPDTVLQKAFYSIFRAKLSAIIYLPRATGGESRGEEVPFSISPVALERTDDGVVLITAAINEYESGPLLPGSDLYYAGVYYLREVASGFELKAAYPTALQFWGNNIPRVSRQFTGEPVIISSGVYGLTWMGVSRHWDELYALRGDDPELIGVIPTYCAMTETRDDQPVYRETGGTVVDVVPRKEFVVRYKGDVPAEAKWEFRRDKFVLTSPYPKICDEDYLGSIRAAKARKPVFKGRAIDTAP